MLKLLFLNWSLLMVWMVFSWIVVKTIVLGWNFCTWVNTFAVSLNHMCPPHHRCHHLSLGLWQNRMSSRKQLVLSFQTICLHILFWSVSYSLANLAGWINSYFQSVYPKQSCRRVQIQMAAMWSEPCSPSACREGSHLEHLVRGHM